ncbi:MAG TPA: hypothetical protein VLH56_02960 [Dissulfurispiraceae bacterium]|nr:hypothetical protein [Dissulfurispiraceae bacterium]
MVRMTMVSRLIAVCEAGVPECKRHEHRHEDAERRESDHISQQINDQHADGHQQQKRQT